MEASGLPDPPSQEPFEAIDEQIVHLPETQPPPELANLPTKLPPSLQPDPMPTTQDLSSLTEAPTTEQTQEPQVQSPTLVPTTKPVQLELSEPQAYTSHLPPPPQPLPENAAESVVPPLRPLDPLPPPSESAESIPNPAPAALVSAPHHDRQEMSQTLPVESWTAPVEHHTPKAPTPSPPTPIATSFDTHQRERLMESPRAPTMSPPTPARDLSSSPDLPLATHGQPPPLELALASEPHIPGLGQQLPTREERIDVEAAPNAPENFAAEIPHEHDPLDGLAAPKIPDEEHKEGEEPARFPDGEEDLLGSLERSLGK